MDRLLYCHSLTFANQAAEDLVKEVVDPTNGIMARATIMSSGARNTWKNFKPGWDGRMTSRGDDTVVLPREEGWTSICASDQIHLFFRHVECLPVQ